MSLTLLTGFTVSAFAPAAQAESIPEEEVIVEHVYNPADDQIQTTPPNVLPGEITNPTPPGATTDWTTGPWIYWQTSNYSSKLYWTTVASAAASIGLWTGIKQLSLAGIIGSWIIANKGNWLYITDVKHVRMLGSVMQTRHTVTYYSNSARTKVVGRQTYYTQDRG
ncbi:hypothetical protein CU633_00405 [Bacillus sp. V3-13]|uniref:hypothetical protein n=1 Tax=Bacillus sp. V3-13 TaxID=2053728 RepID=UPI000C78D332|nr:hypothetical protein [Bacillus sp. V3-13]PLR79472.1 hypothetical protein CU633_00405 [Bacillus sp. V3-13]